MTVQKVLIVLLLVYILCDVCKIISRELFYHKRKKMAQAIIEQCGGCWHIQMPKYGEAPRVHNVMLGCKEYMFIGRNSTGQKCTIFVTEDGKSVTQLPWQ